MGNSKAHYAMRYIGLNHPTRLPQLDTKAKQPIWLGKVEESTNQKIGFMEESKASKSRVVRQSDNRRITTFPKGGL